MNWLIQWTRVLLEYLAASPVVKKSFAFQYTKLHNRVHNCPKLSTSSARWNQFTPFQMYSSRSILVCLGLSSGLFPSGLHTKTLQVFLLSPIRAICPLPILLLMSVDEALRYKTGGREFDSLIGNFYWLNPSDRTMALGSTQILTEMRTRDISSR